MMALNEELTILSLSLLLLPQQLQTELQHVNGLKTGKESHSVGKAAGLSSHYNSHVSLKLFLQGHLMCFT